MLSHHAAAIFLGIFLGVASGAAADRDYLRPGEDESSGAFEQKHRSAVREICERAFRRDVVLRMFDQQPFGPEYTCGLARGARGYRAFITGASSNLSYALYYGLRRDGSKAGDWHKLKRPIYERSIPGSLAARIAALWRRVLRDQRNYGRDPNFYIDTNAYTFYLAFAPNEQLTARMQSFGPHVGQLVDVADALGDYAAGTISEQKLTQAVAKAERKLGT